MTQYSIGANDLETVRLRVGGVGGSGGVRAWLSLRLMAGVRIRSGCNWVGVHGHIDQCLGVLVPAMVKAESSSVSMI